VTDDLSPDDEPSDPSFEDEPSAALAALSLKAESRTGWERHGIEQSESVAAHSWGVAVLAVLLADEWAAVTGESLDRQRALELAVVHDLGEAIVGDVPATADQATKRAAATREEAAMAAFGTAFGVELADRYREFETGDSPEARFVRELDKLDLLLQAVRYETQGSALDEFFQTAESHLDTPFARDWYERLLARHQSVDEATSEASGERRSGDDGD
jgi:Predicted hydrolases of HD superfamily